MTAYMTIEPRGRTTVISVTGPESQRAAVERAVVFAGIRASVPVIAPGAAADADRRLDSSDPPGSPPTVRITSNGRTFNVW